MNNNMMDNNMINYNMINDNIMNNQIMNNNMMNNNMINNPLFDNNMININNTIDLLFQEIYPRFNPMNQNDIQIRQNFENEFLKIFKDINKITNKDKQKDEKMIIINYYNLCKKQIYLDLDLKVEYLISNILSKMGYNYGKKVNKRNKKSQTTKYIIENLIFELNKDIFNIFEICFFFEFNGNNLKESFDKKGYEIGLKEGKEIIIKLNNDNIKFNLFSKQKIIVYFVMGTLSVNILLSENETMKSAIKMFCLKIGIDLNLINNSISFVYNSKKLKGDDLYKTLEQLNVKHLASIEVVDRKDIIGAGPKMMDFVDVSSGKIKKLEFSKNAPMWRKVKKGLNIFGICDNSKCKAWKKEVVYPTYLNDGLTFVLDDEREKIICPMCSRIINLKTCGFWKCEYQFVGQKLEEGEFKNFDSKTKETKDNNFEYYDAFENGESKWKGLTIYVLPKQEIKYESN